MADSKISALTSYTTPLNADLVPIVDTANTTTKQVSWTNIKATLKTYLDTLYPAISQVVITAAKVFSVTNTLTLSGVDGKTLTINKNITLDGTDGTTMTFPTTSATIARTDAANTFTGVQTMTSPAITTPTGIVKGDVGLGNVDNTSDSTKNSATATLTNKRVTLRTATTNAPGATPTTNTDAVDIQIFTGLGTAITSMTTNLSGTPVNGDMVEFIFLDDGTGRAITWGASFASSGPVSLPTTTVLSTALRVLVQYSTVASLNKWVCIATA